LQEHYPPPGNKDPYGQGPPQPYFGGPPDRFMGPGPEGAMGGPPNSGTLQQGSVLMAYGFNMEHTNCDKVFNVFCLYGNVVRVRIHSFLK
jgi:heterogeneous nuclear ribonucleoprotein L